MKKPIQIAIWIRKQKWYSQFRKHVMHNEERLTDKFRILTGRCGKNTISGAFNWHAVLELPCYWEEANRSFILWYYGS